MEIFWGGSIYESGQKGRLLTRPEMIILRLKGHSLAGLARLAIVWRLFCNELLAHF